MKNLTPDRYSETNHCAWGNGGATKITTQILKTKQRSTLPRDSRKFRGKLLPKQEPSPRLNSTTIHLFFLLQRTQTIRTSQGSNFNLTIQRNPKYLIRLLQSILFEGNILQPNSLELQKLLYPREHSSITKDSKVLRENQAKLSVCDLCRRL